MKETDNKKKCGNMTEKNQKNGTLFFRVFLAFLLGSLALAFLLNFIFSQIAGNETMTLISSLMQGIVSAIAAGMIIVQLNGDNQERKKDTLINEAQFYHSFLDYWLETDRMFIEHPECRKYFYDNASIEDLNKDSLEYHRVMMFAEYFDDLFRYSRTELKRQKKTLAVVPDDEIESYLHYMHTISKTNAYVFFREIYGSSVNNNEDSPNELSWLYSEMGMEYGKKD